MGRGLEWYGAVPWVQGPICVDADGNMRPALCADWVQCVVPALEYLRQQKLALRINKREWRWSITSATEAAEAEAGWRPFSEPGAPRGVVRQTTYRVRPSTSEERAEFQRQVCGQRWGYQDGCTER